MTPYAQGSPIGPGEQAIIIRKNLTSHRSFESIRNVGNTGIVEVYILYVKSFLEKPLGLMELFPYNPIPARFHIFFPSFGIMELTLSCFCRIENALYL
jgi:hypothetical protein